MAPEGLRSAGARAARGGKVVADDDELARQLATSTSAIFDGVASERRGELVASGFARWVKRGEEIFEEGTPSKWGYVVCEGGTALGRSTAGHKRQLMTLFLPGDVFGLVNILDGSPYTARAVAITDSLLLQLPAAAVRRWPTLDPSVATSMVAYFAHQVLRANTSVAALLCPDVGGRLASFLLDLADRVGVPTPDGVLIRHTLTQDQLAHYIGASRESVNRALRDMVRRRVLAVEYGELRLLDRQWLHHKSQRA